MIKIFCVTNKIVPTLDKTNLILAGVGQTKFPDNYLKCDGENNIFHKEKFYSELTFHYWYWKNMLANEDSDWVGFCQKRRFWINNDVGNKSIDEKNFTNFLLDRPLPSWEMSNSVICDPIKVSGAKKIKLLKRGLRNIISQPSLLWKKNSETIKIHFDMHHGYGNLDKAISLLEKNERNEFRQYVNTNDEYNPHIMFIARPEVIDQWFKSLFLWLDKCESRFGFKNLYGYDTGRIYAYLAERYLSYWFKKYTKFKTNPWVFINN